MRNMQLLLFRMYRFVYGNVGFEKIGIGSPRAINVVGKPGGTTFDVFWLCKACNSTKDQAYYHSVKLTKEVDMNECTCIARTGHCSFHVCWKCNSEANMWGFCVRIGTDSCAKKTNAISARNMARKDVLTGGGVRMVLSMACPEHDQNLLGMINVQGSVDNHCGCEENPVNVRFCSASTPACDTMVCLRCMIPFVGDLPRKGGNMDVDYDSVPPWINLL